MSWFWVKWSVGRGMAETHVEVMATFSVCSRLWLERTKLCLSLCLSSHACGFFRWSRVGSTVQLPQPQTRLMVSPGPNQCHQSQAVKVYRQVKTLTLNSSANRSCTHAPSQHAVTWFAACGAGGSRPRVHRSLVLDRWGRDLLHTQTVTSIFSHVTPSPFLFLLLFHPFLNLLLHHRDIILLSSLSITPPLLHHYQVGVALIDVSPSLPPKHPPHLCILPPLTRNELSCTMLPIL